MKGNVSKSIKISLTAFSILLLLVWVFGFLGNINVFGDTTFILQLLATSAVSGITITAIEFGIDYFK